MSVANTHFNTTRQSTKAGASSYLLLAVSAEQDDEHQQQDDPHAHDEQGEVGHKGHDKEQRPHLGCWVIVDGRRLRWREMIIDLRFTHENGPTSDSTEWRPHLVDEHDGENGLVDELGFAAEEKQKGEGV